MAKTRRKPKKHGGKARRVYLLDPGQMKALANPLRVEALAIIAQGKASPKEIAAKLGEKLPSVSYHVKVLQGYGLIEQVDEVPRRGATEHFYRAVDPTVIPPGLTTPLLVDEVGAREIERLRRNFGKSLLKVQREANKRLERAGD
jgi:DNA-binding transcriptional ArsR family regulator